MKKGIFKVLQNKRIAKDIYEMVLRGDTSAITAPGQFVNIELSGFYLRRPISVCDLNKDKLTLIYKTLGKGTEFMSTLPEGDLLDLLTGLGNGFDTEFSGEAPLLIGGGVGVPPLYYLAKKLVSQGRTVRAILGFNKSEEVFYADEFKAAGAEVYVTTADGSMGARGFVTDVLSTLPYSYIYTCGPEAMLKAVYDKSETDGQFSFEERMACGFGACMGCSCKTKYGNKRICKDGPVLKKDEIIW